MSSHFHEFCQERRISPKIEEAFKTYIRSSYSSAYAIKEGETLNKMLGNMTREKVEEMWQLFVTDLKQILVSI